MSGGSERAKGGADGPVLDKVDFTVILPTVRYGLAFNQLLNSIFSLTNIPRLRYLVNEEREVAKSDNREMDALRAEIAALRLAKPDLDHVPQQGPSALGKKKDMKSTL